VRSQVLAGRPQISGDHLTGLVSGQQIRLASREGDVPVGRTNGVAVAVSPVSFTQQIRRLLTRLLASAVELPYVANSTTIIGRCYYCLPDADTGRAAATSAAAAPSRGLFYEYCYYAAITARHRLILNECRGRPYVHLCENF